jgi:uncharacterized membrane protein YphA (DoxX/SURF4 family)
MNAFGWRAIEVTLRLVIGGLFVTAGLLKLPNPNLFQWDIRAYRVVPAALEPAAARAIPPLEIAAGLCVVFGLAYLGGLLVVASLMALFLCATILAWAHGLDINCGCFGPSAAGGWTQSYPALVGRDIALLIGIFILAGRAGPNSALGRADRVRDPI